MASGQSRRAWLPLTHEETDRAPRAARAAPAAADGSATTWKLVAAALTASMLALALLAMAVAAGPRAPPRAWVSGVENAMGLSQQAKLGKFASKMNALVSAGQAGPDSGKGWWEVVHPAILREGRSLDSAKLAVLRLGEHVLVSEVRGRRARVEVPRQGWVSTKTADGETLLEQRRIDSASPGGGLDVAGPWVPKLPPRVPGAEDWKKMSASELHRAIARGKVNRDDVMAEGLGKLSGFLSQSEKALSALVREAEEQHSTPGSPAAPTVKGTKEMLRIKVPTLGEVREQLARNTPFARAAGPLLKDDVDAAAASKDPRRERSVGREAVQVTKELLREEGQRLRDATQDLTGDAQELIKRDVEEMQDRIARARATADKEQKPRKF